MGAQERFVRLIGFQARAEPLTGNGFKAVQGRLGKRAAMITDGDFPIGTSEEPHLHNGSLAFAPVAAGMKHSAFCVILDCATKPTPSNSALMKLPRPFLALTLLSSTALFADEPKQIELWPEGVPGLRADATPEKIETGRASNVHHPYLVSFPAPADKANGTAVIICPGGGYMRLSIENEGSLVAARLNAIGVSAFVLHYRMVEYGHPAPLRDVLRAIRLVRSRAAELGVKSDRIGVLGSSAGGHLAASASTLFNDTDGKTGAELDAISGRPDFAVLLYPVITMKDPFVHAGSRKALLGASASPEAIEHMSLELRVTKETPPTFLVATEEDKTVPVENTLMYYQALRKAGVDAELHVWPKGPHGFGMRNDLPGPSSWSDRCEEWLRRGGWLTAAK